MEQTTGDGDALGLTFAESTTPLSQFGVETVGLTTNGDLAFRRFDKTEDQPEQRRLHFLPYKYGILPVHVFIGDVG